MKYLKTEDGDVCPTTGEPISIIREPWRGHENIIKATLHPCETQDCAFRGAIWYKKNKQCTVQCLYKGKSQKKV